MYNVNMAGNTTKLLNVRLNVEDAQKVDFLRQTGVEISELVRGAIREEYARRSRRPKTPEEIQKMLERLHAKYPIPHDLPPRTYNVHDRKEARQAIVEHLQRKRNRS